MTDDPRRCTPAYSCEVGQPCRLTIPACIGCGAMRLDQGCPGDCAERRLELVRGGDYDQLADAAAACRARIQGLRPVVAELARAEPEPGGWQAAYEALQQSARSALRRFKPAPAGRDDPLSPADTVVVWRCRNCGGLDAPQPCIDVCIWRPAVWVDAACHESARSAAAADHEVERSLAGLLGRLAFATPHAGHWEQGLRALQLQARHALDSLSTDAAGITRRGETLLRPESTHHAIPHHPQVGAVIIFPGLPYPDVTVKYMFDIDESGSVPDSTIPVPGDPAPVPLERLDPSASDQ